jgi:hypothetical protein
MLNKCIEFQERAAADGDECTTTAPQDTLAAKAQMVQAPALSPPQAATANGSHLEQDELVHVT